MPHRLHPSQRLHPLFSAEGEVALADLLLLRPLMAFDFDGTLAPIVARPEDARIPKGVTTRLHALAARLPVAIVTGRALADLQGRLGFEPRFVVGNHGAEDSLDPARNALLADRLEGLRYRALERAAELSAAGVLFEDKGASVALHYRLARDRARAQTLIDDLLSPADPALCVFAGKMVVNVTAADAPNKAHAVHALVARSGAGAAFFAGDDINDEPVFGSAPAHWLTVRVGRDGVASKARFCVDGPSEMPVLLDKLLAILARYGTA